MLSDSLLKLEKTLENCNVKLNINQIKLLGELLEYFKGGILPAKKVKQSLSTTYVETHKLMIFLVTKKILKPKYKICCEDEISNGMGDVYDDPMDIPIDVCERCEKKCVVIKNLTVVFEVIKND